MMMMMGAKHYADQHHSPVLVRRCAADTACLSNVCMGVCVCGCVSVMCG